VKIVSLNAWGGAEFSALSEWVPQIGCDVLCLQEVTRTPGLSGWTTFADGERSLPQRADLFTDVRQLLPRHQAWFVTSDSGPVLDARGQTHQQDFGLAVFISEKIPVITQATKYVHGSFVDHREWTIVDRPRIAQGFRLVDRTANRSADRYVTIVHAHGLRDPAGKHDTPARRAQAIALASLVESIREPDDFSMLCGDLNLLPNTAFHDLRIPQSNANIDHVVVGPTGIFVVDSKNHRGRITYNKRTLWSDQCPLTKQLATLRFEANHVQQLLGRPVVTIMSFVDGNLPKGSMVVDGVHVIALNQLKRTIVSMPDALSQSDILEALVKLKAAPREHTNDCPGAGTTHMHTDETLTVGAIHTHTNENFRAAVPQREVEILYRSKQRTSLTRTKRRGPMSGKRQSGPLATVFGGLLVAVFASQMMRISMKKDLNQIQSPPTTQAPTASPVPSDVEPFPTTPTMPE
jgi:hypothetical protein